MTHTIPARLLQMSIAELAQIVTRQRGTLSLIAETVAVIDGKTAVDCELIANIGRVARENGETE